MKKPFSRLKENRFLAGREIKFLQIRDFCRYVVGGFFFSIVDYFSFALKKNQNKYKNNVGKLDGNSSDIDEGGRNGGRKWQGCK
jgi:hypothetical protein